MLFTMNWAPVTLTTLRKTFTRSLAAPFILFASNAYGQAPLKYEVGGIELTLGTSQDVVLRQLATAYNVQYEETAKAWAIRCMATPNNRVGLLRFTGNRLVFIGEFVGTTCLRDYLEQSPYAMLSALTLALQKVRRYTDGARCVPLDSPLSADVNAQFYECGHIRWFVSTDKPGKNNTFFVQVLASQPAK